MYKHRQSSSRLFLLCHIHNKIAVTLSPNQPLYFFVFHMLINLKKSLILLLSILVIIVDSTNATRNILRQETLLEISKVITISNGCLYLC